MEHPHDRHRIIRDLRERTAAFWDGLRRRDEQSLDGYAFLQQAGEDVASELDRLQKRLKRTLLLCGLACFVLFVLIVLLGRQEKSLEEVLQRPAYDEPDGQAALHLALNWKETLWEQDLLLDLPSRELTKREAEERFDQCAAWLETEVFGKNQPLERVTADLKLPLQTPAGSVALCWSSSDPSRIAEDGRVNLTGARDGEKVVLSASLQAGEFGRDLFFPAVLAPSAAKDLSHSLQAETERVLQDLPGSLTDLRQDLPQKSPAGAEAFWTVQKPELPWEIAGVFILAASFLLFSRTDSLKRRLKAQKAAFEQEIPNMSLQMILLLNAGLTVDGSFQKLVEENRDRDHPLYRALASLEAESRATNLPFVNALYVYARQSGIRDLIRFSSLALDCSGRGAELAEKLDRERQQLWNVRLNQAKAKAKEAETKLCLPLMILLLVLVVIAIAPALMEM